MTSKQESTDRVYAYDYRELHNDLENQNFAGFYGGDNTPYLAIAEVREGKDLQALHSHRTKDEVYITELKELLDDPETQKSWGRIVTFDPFGMTATSPTIAGTTAILNIPELEGVHCDGKIVMEDGSVNCTKAAVYNAWNLPHLAERLNITEDQFRKALHKHTNNPDLLDEKIRCFLPSVGGFTAYLFGDPRKLRETKTEVAVRVHDECNGSDVFGTDICTCRPYLMFAVRACVECAQRGGVGVVVYFRKEGRSLGEVTKYRVYNARRNQDGGDNPEKYFYQTESIAGVRDARFQTMMPDVLNWLGIRRIDWLLSMSSEKYDAIREAGVEVSQRVSLPDSYVPKHATVELTAKIMSGYHTDTMSSDQVVGELRELKTIRERCGKLYEIAKKGELNFIVHDSPEEGKPLSNTINEVVKCIETNYPTLNIPTHSRFRHFDKTQVDKLINSWRCDKVEKVRRLIDLATVSVLLDAGAGPNWKYIDGNGNKLLRSEGLAIASFDMFCSGLFSSDPAVPTRVNSLGLKNLTIQKLKVAFQISKNNVMVGLEGRCQLLQRLGEALEIKTEDEFFGQEVYRPGHLVDYVMSKADNNHVSVNQLWKGIVAGLETIWPKRLSGVRRGDVWVHNALKEVGVPGSDMVPFHKLSQWLCFSLMEPFAMLDIIFDDVDQMTCLAEYRNGGLLVDTGVLVLKEPIDPGRQFDVGSELIVEWRALTVMLIDQVADGVRAKLKKTKEELPLSKILEGGTWRAGREIAKRLRENDGPPINLRSDGSVF